MYDFSNIFTGFGQYILEHVVAAPAGEKITIPPNVPGASGGVPTFRISEENESFVHSVFCQVYEPSFGGLKHKKCGVWCKCGSQSLHVTLTMSNGAI